VDPVDPEVDGLAALEGSAFPADMHNFGAWLRGRSPSHASTLPASSHDIGHAVRAPPVRQGVPKP
jgi:hypothetical protein